MQADIKSVDECYLLCEESSVCVFFAYHEVAECVGLSCVLLAFGTLLCIHMCVEGAHQYWHFCAFLEFSRTPVSLRHLFFFFLYTTENVIVRAAAERDTADYTSGGPPLRGERQSQIHHQRRKKKEPQKREKMGRLGGEEPGKLANGFVCTHQPYFSPFPCSTENPSVHAAPKCHTASSAHGLHQRAVGPGPLRSRRGGRRNATGP